MAKNTPILIVDVFNSGVPDIMRTFCSDCKLSI